MSYLGSKAGAGVWQRIAAEIPPHDLLIVPFAGQCALSRNLQPASKRLLFDRDRRVCDFWDDIYPSADANVACRNECGIEYLEAIVSACDSEEMMPFPKWAAPEFETTVDQLEWFDERVVVYCDPPYLVGTRTSSESRYKYDMTDADHERLLSVIRRLPCRVLISGYDSQLYRDRLHDWRLVTFNATTRGRQKVRREHLWINRDRPETTHAPLMVATSKRKREVLKRRLERIERKAARIPQPDVEQWLTCLRSRQTRSGTGSPVVATVPSIERCCDVDRAAPVLTPTAEAFEVLKEVALPPWSDSDHSSLLETLRTRAHNVLEKCGQLDVQSPNPATLDREIVSHRGGRSPAASRRIDVTATPIVLSLFPGIGLLDMAFRETGFEIVSGPDLIFGGDIRQFSSAHLRGVVSGVIGGPPCQEFSVANMSRDFDAGMEMVREFMRVVTECQPDWWLAENVPQVPDIQIDGYSWQRCGVHNEWFPQREDVCARRHRVFQWGTRFGGPQTDRLLDLRPPVSRPKWREDQIVECVVAGRRDGRNWREKAALMGLPDDFDVPCLRRDELAHAIGNGVPLPMGRFVAAAVVAAIGDAGSARSQTARCVCPCRLPLERKRRDQQYHSSRCRQEALARRNAGRNEFSGLESRRVGRTGE